MRADGSLEPAVAEPEKAASHAPWRRWVRWLLLAVAALLVVAVIAFVSWGLTPLGPSPVATAAMRSTPSVRVTDSRSAATFTPARVASMDASAAASGSAAAKWGIILYPGGHVDHRSYAPLARMLAQEGYLVVVPRMPLSLAVLKPNAARGIMKDHPEIGRWAIGGHSLGGAMAASFAEKSPQSVDALFLLASYPAGSADLSGSAASVSSLLGSRDTVVSAQTWEDAKTLLPPATTYLTVEGGNHAQFGSYGEQPGDSAATIAPAEQWRQTVAAIRSLLQ